MEMTGQDSDMTGTTVCCWSKGQKDRLNIDATTKLMNGKVVRFEATKPTAITLSWPGVKGDNITVKLGWENFLTVKLNPKDAIVTCKFKSSDKGVVSVDKYGCASCNKAGTATITVTTDNGLKATLTITVKK